MSDDARTRVQEALPELADLLVSGTIRSADDVVLPYVTDQSGMPGGRPAAVVTPRSVDEVSTALSWASRHRVPVVPRGAGTGVSGAACAVDDGVVLDLTRMDQIVEIDPAARIAVVQPGVINAAVSAAAVDHGLMYAPDPASWESSTIGGNIATNAGGLRCLRYGVTRASVLGLTVVLADGRVLQTDGRTMKRSAGYDLTQLFIGSEGTLGVVVEATLRLQPLPPPQLTALLTFADGGAAAQAAMALASEATPTLLELMDRRVVAALDAHRGTGFGGDVGAQLLVQADDTAETSRSVEAAGAAADVVFATDATEARELLDIRRSVFPAVQQLGRLLLEDICVPLPQLGRTVETVGRIAEEEGVDVPVVAHAGDGNLHPVLVMSDGNEEQVRRAADRIFRAAIEVGGTVSGEHGIGRLKAGWLQEELSPTALDVQRSVKAALDPLGILNPGAVLA